MSDILRLEIDGRVGRLVLDAPPKNEMNAAFFDALHRVCAEELPRHALHALVIHGSARHFSSGADIPGLRACVNAVDGQRTLRENLRSFGIIAELPIPTVAAISGCCLGAGLELALACRYRVAGANAVFAAPETSYGIIPGCGGTVRLTRLVGMPLALDLILSGRLVAAEEALRIGLVDRIVDRARLTDEAVAMARAASLTAGGAPA